ncbi:hypothetical protein BDR07DRAFT_1489247 [Suillus spraguei]|nr:hypothetical protein BDR07DRAFT_1489247 [Suillus spraguei]
MISTTFYVASRLAITGFISVSFFEETVLRPIRSGPRKVSAGLVVRGRVNISEQRYKLTLAGGHIPDAVLEARRLLGTACPTCKLHQGPPDDHAPVNFALPVPAEKFFLHSSLSPSSSPRDIFTALDLPNIAICKRFSTTSDTTLVACDDDRLTDVLLPFHHLSSPVLESAPFNITTILDLPNLSTCKRLSVASDTGSVASSDDSKDTFPNKENYAMSHPSVRASVHITMDDDRVDVPAPSTTIDIISPSCTPYIRPLALNQCQITPTHITHHSVSGSALLTDASLQTTKTVNSLHSSSPSVVPDDGFIHLEGVFIGTEEASSVDIKAIEHHIDALPSYTPALAADDALVIENALPICNALSHPPDVLPLSLLDSFPILMSTTNPSGSAHPTDTLTHKTKAAASWLKPLILVTKYAAAGRLTTLPPTALPYQPEKSRPCELKQQKRKPRSSRMNAACHSIMRSHLRRHADRIIGHLARVCEQIHVENGDLVNGWVTSMAAVGLTSMLAGNHRTSPGSPLPPILDTFSTSEPGLRIKARVISLRHRTNAVAAAIPATTTFPFSPRRRCTS